MKVVITGAGYRTLWYANSIGEVFEVDSKLHKVGMMRAPAYYLHKQPIKDEVHYIFAQDCEVLKPEKIEFFGKHYSGDDSREFWSAINNLPIEADRQELYSLGCALQELESRVLSSLEVALQNKTRMKSKKQSKKAKK